MAEKSTLHKFADFCSKNRCGIFLFLCLVVHVDYAIFFGAIDIHKMMYLNIISSSIYVVLLFVFKRTKRAFGVLFLAQLEIALFAMHATLFSGREAGFYMYIIGLISILFLVEYDSTWQNVTMLISGLVYIVAALITRAYAGLNFNGVDESQNWWSPIIYNVNMVICIVFIVSCICLYLWDATITKRLLEESNKQLEYLAQRDSLTRLHNRRSMEYFLEHAKNRVDEQGGQFAIALCDIDNFKQVNDGYGHNVGDKVLVAVADLFRATMIDTDYICRWGGDEILVLFDFRDIKAAKELLEEFQRRLEVIQIEGFDSELTMTMGICAYESPEVIEHLIGRADQLLYQGKRHGKNRIIE